MSAKDFLPPVTVHVCTQCGMARHPVTGKPQANPAARQLVDDLRSALQASTPDLAPPINVRLSRCLGACEHPNFTPCAYAYTSPAHETLVFWGGGGVRQVPHITASIAAYAQNRPGRRYREPHLPKTERSLCYARVPAPPTAAEGLPPAPARSKPEHD